MQRVNQNRSRREPSLCLLVTTIVTVGAAYAFGEESDRSAADYVSRGMERFRVNEISASIEDFERAAELSPRLRASLWQLGISYYYAGEYAAGQRQFEIHQRVNPHDVENAAWHFICLARVKDVETARNQLLEIDTTRDTRVPMREVYRFYAGLGTASAVLEAAERANTQRAPMYAHLYLGLYYEVDKQPELARKHLRKSAAAQLENNYMHDVARVHLLQRQWEPQPPIKN